MSIPNHSSLSGEPRDCSIDIQTDKVVHTGVMFLPNFLQPENCLGIDINSMTWKCLISLCVWGGVGAYYLYQFLNISLAQASSGKNITPVCTTLSVCIPID